MSTVQGLDPDEITRDDGFFERGGISLSAVQLVLEGDDRRRPHPTSPPSSTAFRPAER